MLKKTLDIFIIFPTHLHKNKDFFSFEKKWRFKSRGGVFQPPSHLIFFTFDLSPFNADFRPVSAFDRILCHRHNIMTVIHYGYSQFDQKLNWAETAFNVNYSNAKSKMVIVDLIANIMCQRLKYPIRRIGIAL